MSNVGSLLRAFERPLLRNARVCFESAAPVPLIALPTYGLDPMPSIAENP